MLVGNIIYSQGILICKKEILKYLLCKLDGGELEIKDNRHVSKIFISKQLYKKINLFSHVPIWKTQKKNTKINTKIRQ